MKINELETLLSISRSNIRFYEKEGLLTPERSSNGYRDYSPKDVARLKEIIIFRKLGLSVAQIHEILDGTLSISDAMEQNIEQLNRQIEELNGALKISKIIKKEQTDSSDFDEEHYWELICREEKNGAHFFEFVKDYLEFEKKTFINLWLEPLLGLFGVRFQKYGKPIAFCLLLLLCTIHGLLEQFCWKNASFLEGFSYPFVLFGFLALFTFPIYLLNHKYKDVPVEKQAPVKKPTKYPALLLLAKLALTIAYIMLYLIGIPFLLEILFSTLLIGNNTAYIMTFPLFWVYFITGLYVLILFLFLFSKDGIFTNALTGEPGLKSNLPPKIKRKTALFSLLAFFLSMLIFISWSDTITEDEIIAHRFFAEKEYRLEDVDHYTLSAAFDGSLKYTIVMNDGTKVSCLASTVSMSNLPEETYPEEEDDFIRNLTQKFSDMGIEAQVKDWDKLIQKLKYDYWKDLTNELREIAG